MTVRVLIADDEPEVREILISVVDAAPGLELAGVAADAEKAVEVARVTRPDVALLDVSMPGGGGVRAALGIGWRSPRTCRSSRTSSGARSASGPRDTRRTCGGPRSRSR